MKVMVDKLFEEINITTSTKEEKIQILKRLLNKLKIKDIIRSIIILFTSSNSEIRIEIISDLITIYTNQLEEVLEIIGYYNEEEENEKTRWGE